MSTPDALAAALPEPQWKGFPLPEVGRAVAIKYPVKHEGRTSWSHAFGYVTSVAQPSDNELIITLHNGKSYLINSGSLLDKWAYADEGPVVATQSIIDYGDRQQQRDVEHENKVANDPVYRHQFEVMGEKIALNKLKTERGDFDDTPFGPDVSDEETATVGDGIPAPEPQSLPAIMRRLAWLDDQVKACEAEAAGYKTEFQQLEARAIEEMAMEGVPAMTVDGSTWFIKSTPYVEKIDDATGEEIMQALRASGLGHMIKDGYNGNQLRSLLIEYRDSEGQIPVPEPLAAVVQLAEQSKIGRTRAASRKRITRTSPSAR